MSVLAAARNVAGPEPELAHCAQAGSSRATTIDAHEARHLQLVPTGPRNLAELIDTAWAGLGAEAPVACPVCDERMEPRLGATGVVGGACRSCGSTLT